MLASTTRTSEKINQKFTGSNGTKVLVTGNGDQPAREILVTYPDGMKASVTVEGYDDGGAVFLTGGKIGNQTMTPDMLSDMRKMLASAGMPNVVLSKSEEPTSRPTPHPGDLLGSNGKPSGKRINTDHPGIKPTPDELFEKLTGGKSKTSLDGTKFGDNGVRIRWPGKGKGTRMDIPANGSKSHATIQFPSRSQL